MAAQRVEDFREQHQQIFKASTVFFEARQHRQHGWLWPLCSVAMRNQGRYSSVRLHPIDEDTSDEQFATVLEAGLVQLLDGFKVREAAAVASVGCGEAEAGGHARGAR